MKTIKHSFLTLLTFITITALPAFGQGTPFTYQGRLLSGGSPATGLYEINFALYDAVTNGSIMGTPVTIAPVAVSNGLFTVLLDYGAAPFNGNPRWLEIAVNIYGSDMVPTTVHPRQPLTATPYAVRALTAKTVKADGPVEITVNGHRALRLEAAPEDEKPGGRNDPNVIGGSYSNSVEAGTGGAFIGGGSMNTIGSNAVYGVIAGGVGNRAAGHNATVGGGRYNTNDGFIATIGGGQFNTSDGSYGVVGGGSFNTSSGEGPTVAGGGNNTASGGWATVSGGYGNIAAGNSATIPGGAFNRATGALSFAAGHFGNALHDGAFVWADYSVTPSFVPLRFDSITPNEFAVRATGGVRFVTNIETNGTPAAGMTFAAHHAANRMNSLNGPLEFAVNGERVLRLEPTPDDDEENNAPNVIGGSAFNRVHAGIRGATIGGGGGIEGIASLLNFIGSDFGTIGGGSHNTIQTNGASEAVIGGGYGNSTKASVSTIAGGGGNFIGDDADGAAIGGGELNRIFEYAGYSTIAGGLENDIFDRSDFSVIGGGFRNNISSESLYSVIPGGTDNRIGEAATGISYAFAAGRQAHANHSGTFLWADSQNRRFSSTASNEFSVRATGGTRFVSATAPNGDPTAGVTLAPGGGSWTAISDRNAKQNFEPVNARVVLDKVVSLPVSTWNYKSQQTGVRHIGPMAQDFKAAFDVGESDTGITTIDADGVALAAIQGLNQKLEAEIKVKSRQIEKLEQRLQHPEMVLNNLGAASR